MTGYSTNNRVFAHEMLNNTNQKWPMTSTRIHKTIKSMWALSLAGILAWVIVCYVLSSETDSSQHVAETNRKLLEIEAIFRHASEVNWLLIRDKDELIAAIARHSSEGRLATADAWGRMFVFLIDQREDGAMLVEIRSEQDVKGLLKLTILLQRSEDGRPMVKTATEATQ